MAVSSTERMHAGRAHWNNPVLLDVSLALCLGQEGTGVHVREAQFLAFRNLSSSAEAGDALLHVFRDGDIRPAAVVEHAGVEKDLRLGCTDAVGLEAAADGSQTLFMIWRGVELNELGRSHRVQKKDLHGGLAREVGLMEFLLGEVQCGLLLADDLADDDVAHGDQTTAFAGQVDKSVESKQKRSYQLLLPVLLLLLLLLLMWNATRVLRTWDVR